MRVEAIQKTGKTVDEAVEEALKELKYPERTPR